MSETWYVDAYKYDGRRAAGRIIQVRAYVYYARSYGALVMCFPGQLYPKGPPDFFKEVPIWPDLKR